MTTYYSVRDGVIIKHTRERHPTTGLKVDTETPQETLSMTCQACGWVGRSLRAKHSPELCICGGRLQVTDQR